MKQREDSFSGHSQNITVGAEAHAAKRGEYEFRAVGMPTDFESQVNAVGNVITQGVTVIAIAPAFSRAKVGSIKKAIEAGQELFDSRTAHWETEEANAVFATMLTTHPDIQGVMAANDSMAIGVVRALEAADRTDILVVGFDNTPAVDPMIDDRRKAEAGNAARLARFAGRIGALDDRLKRGPTSGGTGSR